MSWSSKIIYHPFSLNYFFYLSWGSVFWFYEQYTMQAIYNASYIWCNYSSVLQIPAEKFYTHMSGEYRSIILVIFLVKNWTLSCEVFANALSTWIVLPKIWMICQYASRKWYVYSSVLPIHAELRRWNRRSKCGKHSELQNEKYLNRKNRFSKTCVQIFFKKVQLYIHIHYMLFLRSPFSEEHPSKETMRKKIRETIYFSL